MAGLSAALALIFLSTTVAGLRHNVGTEFIVGFTDNIATGISLGPEVFLSTLSNTPANVTITAPLYDPSLLREAVVTRGTTVKLTLPSGLRGTSSGRETKGVLIQSTEEITVYCVNKETYSTDAFIAIPVEALGFRYYVMTYKTFPTMLIVGTQDVTDVLISLSTTVAYGVNINYESVNYLGGDVLKLRINRFDTVHLYQGETNADFTGTLVNANKPIAVFAGNRKIPVPTLSGSSDHVVEQLTPLSTWGKKFVYVSTPDRTTGDIVRVIAAEASTVLTITGLPSANIPAAGGFVEFDIPSTNVKYISSSKPVMIGVFSKTDPGTETNGGDPSMYVLTPISQYAPNYVFSTVETPSGNFTNYLTLVIETTETSGLNFDNSAVNTLGISWVPVPDTTGLVAGTLAIEPGSHDVYHDNPTVVFMGLCTGVAPYNSYAFSSGMRLALLNEVCSVTPAVAGDVLDNDCDGRIDEEEYNGVAGDVLDNDCDGRIDEEEYNGVDDDGDGDVDEDLALPRRVDGGFSTWSQWSPCSLTCGGNGKVSRTRTCDDPPPGHSGLPCSGEFTEEEQCLPAVPDCPIDGAWAQWGSWDACSVTCGSGNRTRTRSCSNPPTQFNGAECTGEGEEVLSCSPGVSCPVDGGWGGWTTWSPCNVSCADGFREKSRSCDDPVPAHNGTLCDGDDNQSEACDTGIPCPIDGGFTSWSDWSQCSVTCENGTQTRMRTCTNPRSQHGGSNCSSEDIEEQDCHTPLDCPVAGGWGSWGPLSTCSLSCGGGYQVRNRPCNNPHPQHGGDCPGVNVQQQLCSPSLCWPSHSNLTCRYMFFPCRDGSDCISMFKRCDCVLDCADGSDEDEEYGRCVHDIDRCAFQAESAQAGLMGQQTTALVTLFTLLHLGHPSVI